MAGHADRVPRACWRIVLALASVIAIVAFPFRETLARGPMVVSPNCAQRAALAAFATTVTIAVRCRTARRAVTVQARCCDAGWLMVERASWLMGVRGSGTLSARHSMATNGNAPAS